MKTFREQVKEIKLWHIPYWIGMVMLFFSLLFILFILANIIMIGDLPKISEKLLIFCINITISSPVVGGILMVLSGIGIGRRLRCPKCQKILGIRKLERMGDEFLCPYCHNREFGKY